MVGKRKAEDELSNNPHTVKARTRAAGLGEVEKSIDMAKRADTAAITYAFKKLRKQSNYINAGDNGKRRLKQDMTDEIVRRRYVICRLY